MSYHGATFWTIPGRASRTRGAERSFQRPPPPCQTSSRHGPNQARRSPRFRSAPSLERDCLSGSMAFSSSLGGVCTLGPCGASIPRRTRAGIFRPMAGLYRGRALRYGGRRARLALDRGRSSPPGPPIVPSPCSRRRRCVRCNRIRVPLTPTFSSTRPNGAASSVNIARSAA